MDHQNHQSFSGYFTNYNYPPNAFNFKNAQNSLNTAIPYDYVLNDRPQICHQADYNTLRHQQQPRKTTYNKRFVHSSGIASAGKPVAAPSKKLAITRYCDVCNVSMLEDLFDTHLNGSKHKKTIESLNFIELSKKRDPSVFCQVCDVLMRPELMAVHLAGKSHRKKVANAAAASANKSINDDTVIANQCQPDLGSIASESTHKSTNNNNISNENNNNNLENEIKDVEDSQLSQLVAIQSGELEQCEFDKDSADQANASKHAEISEVSTAPTTTITTTNTSTTTSSVSSLSKLPEFSCRVCALPFSDAKPLLEHFYSVDHAQAVLKSPHTLKMSATTSNAASTSLQNSYFCAICNAEMPDEAALKAHLNGIKHAKRMRRLNPSGQTNRGLELIRQHLEKARARRANKRAIQTSIQTSINELLTIGGGDGQQEHQQLHHRREGDQDDLQFQLNPIPTLGFTSTLIEQSNETAEEQEEENKQKTMETVAAGDQAGESQMPPFHMLDSELVKNEDEQMEVHHPVEVDEEDSLIIPEKAENQSLLTA